MIVYRPMTPEDIPSGLLLCRTAGWNQTAFEWKLFLTLSPDSCRVATDENGDVVGTVTTVRYKDHFCWIGMVLVDPGRQRQGIGLQLLKESMQILRNEDTVKLDATPSGREVYLKLAFRDEYRLNRLHWSSVSGSNLPVTMAIPLLQGDLTEVSELDRQVFGADRQMLLQWLFNEAGEYAFILREGKKIKGYCFGRPGYNYSQIGPLVAHNTADAIQLISAALQNCVGSPVILDAPEQAIEWVSWLSTLGFAEQRPLIRMVRGSNVFPGLPQKQFAILGPEFG